MAADDNILGIVVRISAAPSLGEAGIEALEAKLRELDAQVGKSGEAFAEYQKVSKQLWEARYEAPKKATQATAETTQATKHAVEPVIVYGEETRRTAEATQAFADTAERPYRRVQTATESAARANQSI